jgi:hypothetical protein
MVGIISEEHTAAIYSIVGHFKASGFYIVTASNLVTCCFTLLAAYGSLCPTHFPYLACVCPQDERNIFLQISDNHLLDSR